MSNPGNLQKCESLWMWLPANFQVLARTAPVRKHTLHISVWPSHRQIKLWEHVPNARKLNFGSLWYSHWSIKSITSSYEMQSDATTSRHESFSKGCCCINKHLMCYHCLWKDVLGVLSSNVRNGLRNHIFHTFQSAVTFLLNIIHFLAHL